MRKQAQPQRGTKMHKNAKASSFTADETDIADISKSQTPLPTFSSSVPFASSAVLFCSYEIP